MPIAEQTTRAYRAPDRFEAWRNGLNDKVRKSKSAESIDGGES
jgi:hypothetical protein